MKVNNADFFRILTLVYLCVLGACLVAPSISKAGAPQLREECQDPDGRPVRSIFNSNLRVFAEARMMPPHEREEAVQRGLSPFVIFVNPERYYLGRYTQRWLYRRQCIRIGMHAPAIEEGRPVNIDEEQAMDCIAIHAMREDPERPVSPRQVESIERDMERLLGSERWGEVLPGPERRVTLMNCN